MEQKDDPRLLPRFQPQPQKGRLGGDGEKEQRIIARNRPAGLPDQFRDDDSCEEKAAEQAGLDLFQHEHHEFGQPMRQPRAGPVAERAFKAWGGRKGMAHPGKGFLVERPGACAAPRTPCGIFREGEG